MESDSAGWMPPKRVGKGYPKHLPRHGEDWAKTVRGTQGPGKPARYHPDLADAEIERLEMSAFTPAQIDSNDDLEIRELTPSPRRNERIFVVTAARVIGASQGRETNLVYVIYNQSGPVHGYPVLASELPKAGANP